MGCPLLPRSTVGRRPLGPPLSGTAQPLEAVRPARHQEQAQPPIDGNRIGLGSGKRGGIGSFGDLSRRRGVAGRSRCHATIPTGVSAQCRDLRSNPVELAPETLQLSCPRPLVLVSHRLVVPLARRARRRCPSRRGSRWGAHRWRRRRRTRNRAAPRRGHQRRGRSWTGKRDRRAAASRAERQRIASQRIPAQQAAPRGRRRRTRIGPRRPARAVLRARRRARRIVVGSYGIRRGQRDQQTVPVGRGDVREPEEASEGNGDGEKKQRGIQRAGHQQFHVGLISDQSRPDKAARQSCEPLPASKQGASGLHRTTVSLRVRTWRPA